LLFEPPFLQFTRVELSPPHQLVAFGSSCSDNDPSCTPAYVHTNPWGFADGRHMKSKYHLTLCSPYSMIQVISVQVLTIPLERYASTCQKQRECWDKQYPILCL
jgi:hypothetical protein